MAARWSWCGWGELNCWRWIKDSVEKVTLFIGYGTKSEKSNIVFGMILSGAVAGLVCWTPEQCRIWNSEWEFWLCPCLLYRGGGRSIACPGRYVGGLGYARVVPASRYVVQRFSCLSFLRNIVLPKLIDWSVYITYSLYSAGKQDFRL